MNFQEVVNNVVGPLAIMSATTVLAPLLPILALGVTPSWPTPHHFLVIIAFAVFEYCLLRFLPGPTVDGPETKAGRRPEYRENGVLAFAVTFIATIVLCQALPASAVVGFFSTFGAVALALEAAAFVLCFVLYFTYQQLDGLDPDFGPTGRGPIFDFYWGVVMHPRVLGVDLKQMVNCRFGMMSWVVMCLLACAYQFHVTAAIGSAVLVSALLQSVYIFKFFVWEQGYTRSIDIQQDRAGFMTQLGCLLVVPTFYTLPIISVALATKSAEFNVAHVYLLILGMTCIYLNYDCDRQKIYVRESEGKCEIWGKPVEVIQASYTIARPDGTIETRMSLLLCSGWWGLARHAHYMFELGAALSWSAVAGLQAGIWPYLYFLFLTPLLIHRIFRDEDRCREKYGLSWEEYTQKVRWKMIPGIF